MWFGQLQDIILYGSDEEEKRLIEKYQVKPIGYFEEYNFEEEEKAEEVKKADPIPTEVESDVATDEGESEEKPDEAAEEKK